MHTLQISGDNQVIGINAQKDGMFSCDVGSDVAMNYLRTIVTYNSLLCQQGTVGTVCGSKGDLGCMYYALGTRVLPDCISKAMSVRCKLEAAT